MVIRNRVKPFIPFIITALLAVVLFFLVGDFLQSVIITPLLYVIWFLTLLTESIPQGILWVGFLLIVMIIAAASLKQENHQKMPIHQLPIQNSGQVEKWARLLGHAQNDKFTKWRLANELKRLTRRLLWHSDDREKAKVQDDLELPVEIRQFFEAQQPTIQPIWARLNKDTTEETDSALDLDPDVVIQYLEERVL